MTTSNRSNQQPNRKAKSAGKTSSTKIGRRTTLVSANKWMTEAHDAILDAAKRNTARLTGKPRL
jgi:hypothetical protein